MSVTRLLVALATVALVMVGCGALGPSPAPFDRSRAPSLLYTTEAAEIGSRFTVGARRIEPSVPRPVRVVGLEVVEQQGLQILGYAAYEPRGRSIGVVKGWPPEGYDLVTSSDGVAEVRWDGEVHLAFGIETRAGQAALRGYRIIWVDASGRRGSASFDEALVACAPRACPTDVDSETILAELGLYSPP